MKRIIIVLLMLSCLLAGCGPDVATDYPAAIMVHGKIYYLSVEEIPGEVDESAILGYTESYTNTFPEKHGETNFNRELGMPYARVEGGMAVLYDNEWRLCYPKEKGVQQEQTVFLPENMPEDFEFSLTWGCYGISSYDSKTGMLVKATDATHPTDYVACYELSEVEKQQIYEIIRTLNPEDYPDVYDPQEGECMSEPSMTLVLTVKSNGTEKAISAKDIAYAFTAKNKKGQAFLTACDRIKTLLIETEEWKALPDYEFKYE